ncbi:MAG: uncharacterized protein JWO67_1594 [Streptosporangiaceae bacterium]|jgi:hypothetical protein|nr:uncharacterized protein [Streptosporangiaceae bacterium]
MSDTRAIAAAVQDPIGGIGGAFMISREAKEYGRETGLDGWSPYLRGRCGVLGEVDADVVAAAVGFFPPSVVREGWEAGRGLPAEKAAHRYATVCQEFGRRKLAGGEEAGMGRLAELLEAIVVRADVIGTPLAAGWRAMPLPSDAPARVVQLAHVLRELRGGLHLVAVLSSGLTPLQSVLTSRSALVPSGEDNARFFGWPEPYTKPSADVRRRRTIAEQLTDGLMAPAFAGLRDDEASELIALLGKMSRLAFG